jgi:OmpR-family two-component system manganese-sensing sensor histidine kinase
MDKALLSARRKITIFIIMIALGCASISTLGVYIASERAIDNKINAAKLGTLAANNDELSKYIASQEPNHAHFEAIATIIQNQDRNQFNSMLPVVLLITFVFSGLVAWFLSRYLLRPVKESFVSQRRFMQDAAHELRNPLAAMQSLIQQAINNPPNKTKQKLLLESIDRQANHLSAITTDLLLLERREYPGTQETNLEELTNDIIEELHHQALSKNVTIKLNVPKGFTAKIDPQHFVYIVKNLMENAIKFSKAGKTINVYLKPTKNGWLLKVQDRGIGIPKEELENITQRFYRAKNTVNIEGTGLGMAIVAKFTKIYEAQLDISSVYGKGTTVSINF